MTIDQWAQHCVLSLSKENYDEVLNSIDDVLPLLENDLILRPKFHAWWDVENEKVEILLYETR